MSAHARRWPKLGALPAAEAGQMGRAGALLFAPGAVLVLATLPLGGPEAQKAALTVTACSALVTAVLLWFLGHRIPSDAYPVVTIAGSVMITTLVHVGGNGGGAYAFLYVWAVLFSFYFYAPAQAVHQAIVVGALLLAFGNLGGNSPMIWLLCIGTVVVAGVWMRVAVGALSRSEHSFRLLFADNPELMWFFDRSTLAFLAVNDAAVARYGYSRAEFLSMRITDIRPPEDVDALLDGGVVDVDEIGEARRLWRHRRKDGSLMDVEVFSHRQHFNGREAKMVLVVDVSERVRLEEQLRHQAFHDPLTGLANRVLFHDRVQHALARRQRDGAPVAVLLIDLDGFKAVNDSLGHAGGDEVLVEVGRRISTALRPGDTPAHVGGDEFAVLLEDADGDRALAVAVRILDLLRIAYSVVGTDVFVTASIGAACVISREDRDLLRNADIAMYSAKRSGKNRCELYEPTMHGNAAAPGDVPPPAARHREGGVRPRIPAHRPPRRRRGGRRRGAGTVEGSGARHGGT